MSEAINLTPETIETITHRVTERAGEIKYNVTIPADEREAVVKGAPLVWSKIVESEYQYIDSARDEGVTDEVLLEAEVDIEALMDANEDYEVEWHHLPNHDASRISHGGFLVGLSRAITDDLASAWEDVIREVIEEVCGLDPLGGGDGLTFPGE